MRRGTITVALALVVGTAACGNWTAQPLIEQRAMEDGRLMAPEKVADQVWVMRQPDRVWSAVIGNAIIIEQSDAVVLVDSGGTIADGRDIVEAVAVLTDKPVKAVILTHWHNDHPLGVPAILERFPNARIIATKTSAELMADPEVLGSGVGAPDAARYKARLEGAQARSADYLKSAQDAVLRQAVRQEYAAEAAWVLERARRQQGNYVALPTETFTDRLVLDDTAVPVEALFLGQANTKGDAFVWLPRQKIMIAGDAVVAPTPYGFTNAIEPWLATLDRLERHDFRTLIPGHGKVQHDRAYLQTLRWSMNDIRDQSRALAASADTPEAAWARFDKSAQRNRFGTVNAWTQRWLDDYWLQGMFETAFAQAKGSKAGEGAD